MRKGNVRKEDKPQSPILPRYWKADLAVYTEQGMELVIVGVPSSVAGVWYCLAVDKNNRHYTFEWDSHDYTGEGAEPIPKLYRKNPLKLNSNRVSK